MDEKTEELRELFMNVTDSEAVTESQEESRGSLTDDASVRERVEELIREMRERYEFQTDLDDDALCRLVGEFYDGAGDTEIADELDVSRRTVVRARLDLHLIRERDTEASFDIDAFGRRVTAEGETSTNVLAEEFDVSESTVRRYRRVIEARDESRRANDRYRDEFAELLGDADLAAPLTRDAKEDGLEDATEGMETDVSF